MVHYQTVINIIELQYNHVPYDIKPYTILTILHNNLLKQHSLA